MRLKAVLLGMVSFATFSSAQDMASTYRQAAQNYMNAAAQCQNPAGAACMRSNAAYYQCIANHLGGGGACGNQPTCSTACTGNSATGAVSPGVLRR
jgi:hypothetical protein